MLFHSVGLFIGLIIESTIIEECEEDNEYGAAFHAYQKEYLMPMPTTLPMMVDDFFVR